MSGLVLRLAGPMQSWGEHSAFGRRDTLTHPTRSGVIGLCAAARGLPRGNRRIGEYDDLVLTVRCDRPGTVETDYQTIGGGLPAKRTVPKSEGGYRPVSTATIQTWRSFLSGAVFTLALQGPEELLELTASALETPYWQPYLGRRSYVPEEPLLLRRGCADPVEELRSGVPLPPGAARDTVDFVHESRPGRAGTGPTDAGGARTALNDVPAPATGDGRVFTSRDVVVAPEEVPPDLGSRNTWQYRKKLLAYMLEGRP